MRAGLLVNISLQAQSAAVRSHDLETKLLHIPPNTAFLFGNCYIPVIFLTFAPC